MNAHDKLETLLASYKENAEGTGTLDPKRNNTCAKALISSYRELRKHDAGRQGIVTLMSDTNPYVRAWAAAHSLQWEPSIARKVLELLRDSDGPGSFDAKWTLIEFDKGRLRFDY